MKIQHNHRTGGLGFTLVEVMVSVSLVAILATLGVAAMLHHQSTAESTSSCSSRVAISAFDSPSARRTYRASRRAP